MNDRPRILPGATEMPITRIRKTLPLVLITFASMLSATPQSRAQVVNRPPPLFWIKAEVPAQGVVEKQFDYSGKLLKGILFLAVESKTTVSANGKLIGEFERADQAISVDLTASVREGSNVLTLRSS